MLLGLFAPFARQYILFITATVRPFLLPWAISSLSPPTHFPDRVYPHGCIDSYLFVFAIVILRAHHTAIYFIRLSDMRAHMHTRHLNKAIMLLAWQTSGVLVPSGLSSKSGSSFI